MLYLSTKLHTPAPVPQYKLDRGWLSLVPVWNCLYQESNSAFVHRVALRFNWAPRHGGVLGEWRYTSTYSLTSALVGGEWSASRPGRFTPRERTPSTYWIGGWVGHVRYSNSTSVFGVTPVFCSRCIWSGCKHEQVTGWDSRNEWIEKFKTSFITADHQ
jgi:hypothetical protein